MLKNALNELLGDAIQLSAFSYENDFVDEIDTEEDHSGCRRHTAV